MNKIGLSETLFNIDNLETFFRFKVKYPFEILTDSYTIKTADTFKELYAAMRLRYENFSPKTDKSFIPFRIDIDEYDFLCDHIVIVDRKTDKICGTYRIRCSIHIDQYYSQEEFYLDEFLKTPDIKIELGRACISPEYRNGSVIDLLWKGIGMYIRLTKSRYLFGCSSVKTTDPIQAQRLYNMLANDGKVSNQFRVHPLEKHNMNLDVDQWKTAEENYTREEQRMLPPLLRTYLNGGAFVYGPPALDQEFKCIDFLTIMDLENISPSLKKRYFR